MPDTLDNLLFESGLSSKHVESKTKKGSRTAEIPWYARLCLLVDGGLVAMFVSFSQAMIAVYVM